MEALTPSTTPIVDWLSAVIPSELVEHPSILDAQMFGRELASLLEKELVDILLMQDGWENRSGRKPYRDGYANDELGLYVWGGGQKHYLLEITGRGCEYLRNENVFGFILKALQPHLTRLDIAVDIETKTPVEEFASDREMGRIKSHATIVSESGTTCYVGSKQSDQYCRVYRYNEPHPRATQMRIETVSRKHYAKQAALHILSLGVSETAQMTTNRYKFNRLGEIANVNETLPAPYRDRSLAKTERWLLKQAAPAFLKLVQQGEIKDPEQWLQEHFLAPAALIDSVQPKLFPDRD